MPLLNTAFDEFWAHYGEITQVIISPDAKYAFTTGRDGCIFVFSITEYLNEHELYKPIGIEEEKMQVDYPGNFFVRYSLSKFVFLSNCD